MKKIQLTCLVGLCLLCFCSFALMIREAENLSIYTFTFLWICMSMSALVGIVLIKAMEEK